MDTFSGTLRLSAGKDGVFSGPESLKLKYDRAASSSRCIQKFLAAAPTEPARVSLEDGRVVFLFGLPGFEGANIVVTHGTSTKVVRSHGKPSFSTSLCSKKKSAAGTSSTRPPRAS